MSMNSKQGEQMESQVNIDAILKEMRESFGNIISKLVQENAILKTHINTLSANQGTNENADS